MQESFVDKEQQATEDDKTLNQLRVYFVKDNQATFAKITQAIKDDDIKLAHRLAHTLKGNAGQIGEKQLQKAAATTENMLGDRSNAITEAQMELLDVELKKVLEKLAPMLTEMEAKNKTEIADTEKALEIIEKLEPMLKSRNPECMHLLDEVRTLPGAEELVYHVEEFEFKQASAALSRLKEKLVQGNE